MTEEDNTETFPRMYEDIEAFVSKFRSHRLRIKDEGRSVPIKNPITGQKTNLSALIADFVPEYVRLTDAVSSVKKELPTDPDRYGPAYLKANENRLKIAISFSHAIASAYVLNLVDEDSNELDGLRRKNEELKARVADLTAKLEACEKNYKGLKKRVSWDEHKDKKREVGGVSA